MRKTFLIAILCACCMILHAQNYATLTQTGVNTTISGSKSITTFQVDVATSANYYLKFWLMGVKHTDTTYSTYDLRIDNNNVSDQVETNCGDWYLYSPKNSSTVYLTAGSHQISLEGTLNDIPNAERIMGSTNFFANQVGTVMQKYQNKKNHQPLGPASAGHDYSLIEYSPDNNNSSSPAFGYTAELNKEVYYTFCRLEYYTQSQTLSITTDVLNGLDHVVNVFSLSSPESYSWAASSSNGHATLSLTIPQTGFYYVMVRSEDSDDWGTCNLTINNDRVFEDVPVNSSYTEIDPTEAGLGTITTIFACFAKTTGNGDPIIMLMDEVGKVVNYNDDYPYNSSESSYNWGKNARIDRELSIGQWVFTTSKSYPVEQFFDIYTGCQLGQTWWWMPNLKEKDFLYSAPSSVYYNCISWSVGEWLINYKIDGAYITSSPNESIQFYEDLDSLYSAYGYTTMGATENNAIIDLWKRGNVCTHASVRAKGHQYAAGYAWESKMGDSERMFHPRYALESDDYGEVFAHYIEAPYHDTIPYGPILLNIPLNQDEYALIKEGASSVYVKQKNDFNELYEQCRENGKIKVSICIDTYEEIEPYASLLELCKREPTIQYLLYQKICNREILAIKLLKDLTLAISNAHLWYDTRQQLRDRCDSYTAAKLIFSVQAQALLLVKALLSETKTKQELSDRFDKDISYSNDSIIEAAVNGKCLTISFKLQTDAIVSLLTGTIDGRNIRSIMANQKKDKGYYQVSTTVPSSGVYTIGLIVNGCVYKKKIIIK